METLGNILEMKTSHISSNDFYCNICHYKCCKRFNFDRHLLTPKHIKEIDRKQKGAKNEQNEQPITKDFECKKCNKIYQTNAGLWKHKKVCNQEQPIIENNNETDKELIMMLVKQNTQLFEQNNEMLEIIKNGTHNNNNNTTNSHEKEEKIIQNISKQVFIDK